MHTGEGEGGDSICMHVLYAALELLHIHITVPFPLLPQNNERPQCNSIGKTGKVRDDAGKDIENGELN